MLTLGMLTLHSGRLRGERADQEDITYTDQVMSRVGVVRSWNTGLYRSSKTRFVSVNDPACILQKYTPLESPEASNLTV